MNCFYERKMMKINNILTKPDSIISSLRIYKFIKKAIILIVIQVCKESAQTLVSRDLHLSLSSCNSCLNSPKSSSLFSNLYFETNREKKKSQWIMQSYQHCWKKSGKIFQSAYLSFNTRFSSFNCSRVHESESECCFSLSLITTISYSSTPLRSSLDFN